MNNVKRYTIGLVTILGGLIFLSSTTCIRYVDRKMIVLNESDKTIYIVLKCFYSPSDNDGHEYEILHHPAASPWLTELRPGESVQEKWQIEEDLWGKEIIFQLLVIYEENYANNSFTTIVEQNLYDEIIIKNGLEMEAEGFLIVYNVCNSIVE